MSNSRSSSQSVSEAVEGFVPKKVPTELWNAHSQLVLDRVKAARPSSKASAKRLLSGGAGLLVFAAENHIPLEVETLFSDEVIERYVAEEFPGSESTRATIRSSLRQLRNAGTPTRTLKYGHQKVTAPYTRSELAGLWQMISNQPVPRRSERLQAIYCLCLGAGCDAEDLRTVTGDDVYEDNGIVYVAIGGPNPRTVPALTSVGPKLLELANGIGEELVAGGNSEGRNLVNRVIRSAVGGEDLPKMEAVRLRHTWLVAIVNARIPLGLLAQYAGFKTLRTLEDLLDYTEFPPEEVTEEFDFEIAEAMEIPWL